MEHVTTDVDLGLAERYFSGTLNPAEREAFEQWVAVHPVRRQALEDLRAVWTRTGWRGGWNVEGMWRELVVRIRMADPSGAEEDPRSPHTAVGAPGVNCPTLRSPVSPREQFARPALQRIEGVGPQTLWRSIFKSQTLRRNAWYTIGGLALGAAMMIVGWSVITRPVRPRPLASPLMYTTGNGQRATITLPDGSTVALDVASHLEIPADFAMGNHVVHLSGEALFTVSRHTRTPFVVVAGPTTTRVLGTSFLVRYYAMDTVAMVAVRDGKVAVGSTVVTASRLVAMNRRGVARIGVADPSQFGFATGVLTLSRMPLSAALVELDRWYDADVRLGSPLLTNRSVEGDLTAGSLADLAELLRWTLQVRVVRDGRTLTLYPR